MDTPAQKNTDKAKSENLLQKNSFSRNEFSYQWAYPRRYIRALRILSTLGYYNIYTSVTRGDFISNDQVDANTK